MKLFASALACCAVFAAGNALALELITDAEAKLPSAYQETKRAGVTRATITGLLDGLERDALVVRAASAHDRRRLTVRLTPGFVMG